VIYLAGTDWHQRAIRVLTPLLGTAIVVSVVHYTDNYVNYSDFPQDGPLPDPSRWLILAAWFAFTAAGIAGYVLFRRAPTTLSLVLLAVYSGSGLIGFGHYTVPGAFDMPAARQAHVIADILLGLGMFAFVIWAARSRAPTPRRA
jgi:hypothetical protein